MKQCNPSSVQKIIRLKPLSGQLSEECRSGQSPDIQFPDGALTGRQCVEEELRWGRGLAETA